MTDTNANKKVFVGVVNTRKLGYQPIFMNCMGVM